MIPYVYDTPVTTAITDAKQLAGQGKHSEAAGKFSSVANDYKTQKQKAATDRSNDLDDIRRKPVYDDKVRRIKEAIDQLEKLAGTGEHRKQLQKLIDDSASLAKSGKYQDAYKKLKGLSGTLDAGLKAAGKFETEAGDSTFQGLRTAMARNLSRYEEIAGLADADFIKDAHKSDHEILCTLETTPPATLDTAVKEKAIKDIRELDAEIQGKISDVNRVKSLCDPLLEEVDDNGVGPPAKISADQCVRTVPGELSGSQLAVRDSRLCGCTGHAESTQVGFSDLREYLQATL